MAGTVDARLAEQSIELPDAASPAANYVPYTIAGNMVFVSGQITLRDGELKFVGRLGDAGPRRRPSSPTPRLGPG